jgi:DNA-binding MarR family transcriptional regulator
MQAATEPPSAGATGPDPRTPDLSGAVIGAVARTYRRLRAERGTDDLSDTQHTVLARITRDGPCSPSGLAEHAGVSGPSMNQALTGLFAAGLILRVPDPADGRRVQVMPTRHGEAVARAARDRRHAWLDSQLDAMSAAERETLAAAAVILRRITDGTG